MVSSSDKKLTPNVSVLTKQFEALGLQDTHAWAQSQVGEGIDQMSRATVLCALAEVVKNTPRLLDALTGSDGETEQVQAALKRLNVSEQGRKDMALIAQLSAFYAIWDLIVLTDGSAEFSKNPADLSIGLFKMDDDYKPASQIEGLSESWMEVAAEIVGDDLVKS